MSGVRRDHNERMCSKDDDAEGLFLSFVQTANRKPVGPTYGSPTAARDEDDDDDEEASQPVAKKRKGNPPPPPPRFVSKQQQANQYHHHHDHHEEEVEDEHVSHDDDDDENDGSSANNNDPEDNDEDDDHDNDHASTTNSSHSSITAAAPQLPQHGIREAAAAAWTLANVAKPRKPPRNVDSSLTQRRKRSLPLSRGRSNPILTTQPKRSSYNNNNASSMTTSLPMHYNGPTTAQAAIAARHFLTQPASAMAFQMDQQLQHQFQRQQQQQMWAPAPEPLFFVSPAMMMTMPSANAPMPDTTFRVQHHVRQQQQQDDPQMNRRYQVPPGVIPRQVSSPSVETDSPQHELQVDVNNEDAQEQQHDRTHYHDQFEYQNHHSHHHHVPQHHVPHHDPQHPPSPSAAAAGGGNSMEVATQANAVYFGWIRHPATKTWRDVVKRFSQNRKEFPSWGDDICDKVKEVMREEKKIDTFFICRRPVVAVQERPEKKKIFDKNKKNLGTWQVATPQEIMDRTKQRFIDDRKPQAVVVGVKRPRGRPPKTSTLLAREMSASLEGDSSRSMNHIIETLQKFMVKWHSDVRRMELNDNTTKTVQADEGDKQKETPELKDNLESGKDSTSLPQQPPPVAKSSAPVEPKMCLDVMVQLECTKSLLRKRLEEVLDATIAKESVKAAAEEHANEDDDHNDDQDHDGSSSSTSSPRKKEARVEPVSSISMTLSKRSPWFPVLSHHVCFDWKHHVGTRKWLDIVKTFSGDTTLYPKWEDTIAGLVQERLVAEHCSVWLVFLDSNGKPCESIKDGLWYLATDEEFGERTRLQFLQDRQVPDT